jgi:hypothetical protein
MILFAPLAHAPAQPGVIASEHQAAALDTYHYAGAWSPPLPDDVTGEAGEQVEIKPSVQRPLERLEWSNPKVTRRFIKLEQKVLAEKASDEELLSYEQMRRDRNAVIFADKYVRDYAEVQRLRKLAQRLAEIQQYLAPMAVE